MREIFGDIRDYFGKVVVALPTNGSVGGGGKAFLGRGTARMAGEIFPGLSAVLGELIATHGNHVHLLGHGLVSFPVEESAWEFPSLPLIRRSAGELAELADREGWERVVLPRPGCGGGGLQWSEVAPLLRALLDDRFLAITLEG